jgi:hypothetical protein
MCTYVYEIKYSVTLKIFYKKLFHQESSRICDILNYLFKL